MINQNYNPLNSVFDYHFDRKEIETFPIEYEAKQTQTQSPIGLDLDYIKYKVKFTKTLNPKICEIIEIENEDIDFDNIPNCI